jgi:hypothetical protein
MTGNGDHQVREERMRRARSRVRKLAEDGLTAAEIRSRVGRGLNETERAIVLLLASDEVTRARRQRVGRGLDRKA